MSLFDRITPASSTPSLFGGNTSTSAAPATTSFSLFGAPKPATTAAGGGLFGGAVPASAPAPAPAPAQPAANMFHSTAAAAPNINAPIGNGNASVFGTNILPANNPANASALDSIANPTLASAQPAYFQALLLKAEKGGKRTIDTQGGLPPLQLGLKDISRKAQKIGRGGPSAGQARNADSSRAHYLLAASGVNTSEALRDIDDLMDTSTLVRTQQAPDVVDYSAFSDVKDQLATLQQNNFQKMVDDRLRAAQDDFNQMVDEQLHGVDVNAHRQRIYEHFGLRKPQQGADDSTTGAENGMRATGGFGRSSRRTLGGSTAVGSSFGLSNMNRSVIGTLGGRGMRQSAFGDIAEKLPAEGMRTAPEDRVQRMKQEKYANKVKDLNVARVQPESRLYPILHRFSEVEAEPSNADTSMLVHSYKALVQITGEDLAKESTAEPGAVRERQYATAYLDDTQSPNGKMAVRKRILNGSCRFLEQLYATQVGEIVARHPREANIGGVPTPVAKIKGYVRVRASRKELGPEVEILQEINGDYCWAVLFYLIRCGLHNDALAYVEENNSAFRQIDRSFVRYLRAFVGAEDHRLPSDLQIAIHNEYSQRQRLAPEDSLDPYRMLCYKA